jgi:hypothetical protein
LFHDDVEENSMRDLVAHLYCVLQQHYREREK